MSDASAGPAAPSASVRPVHAALPDPSPAARDLQRRAHRAIPGGAHTYAKGDDQFPANAPPLLVRGEGAWVVDVDGNRYVEYGGGLRAIVLGHGHPRVLEAVRDAIADGTNLARPSVLEVQAAEDLLAFLDRPDWMVKFTKNGSDANSAAIRLARAATGRDLVALCHDQPFFSVEDWFIGTTPMDAGIPQAVKDLTVGFPYDDLDALEALLAGREVAAVVMEAAKYDDPSPGWFEGVRRLCDATGTVFVLDEMITGVRWPGRTAMAHYGVEPDLATYGKALGNGFSVSAVTGRRELMSLGGLDHDRPRVFLASYTHGAESVGLAACRAVVAEGTATDIGAGIAARGEELKARLNEVAAAHGVAEHLFAWGPGQVLVFVTRDADGEPSQVMRALAMQEMAAGGVLGTSLVMSLAHGEAEIGHTVSAWERVARTYARALSDGPDGLLRGHPTSPVWRRYNSTSDRS